MKKSTRPAIALAAALALTGCTAAPDPAPSLGSVAPDNATAPAPTAPAVSSSTTLVGGTQAQRDIALDAARIMTSWKPAEDQSPTNAEERARHLMTEARAARVVLPARPGGGADWNRAAQAGATSAVEVTVNGQIDVPNAVEVTATWTWQTPDGQTLPGTKPTIRFYRFAFDPAHPDKIADYAYQDRRQR